MRRLSWPSGGGGLGGLTISEDGGLEEVEESFRAAANCACSWAKATWRVLNCDCSSSSCACNRWQFGQEGVPSAPMAAYSTSHRFSDNTLVNRYYFQKHPPRSIKQARAIIEQHTGVRRGLSQVRHFLKNHLGLRWRKVGAIPVPPKKTIEEHAQEQAVFLREKREPRLEQARQGRSQASSRDAAHCVSP